MFKKWRRYLGHMNAYHAQLRMNNAPPKEIKKAEDEMALAKAKIEELRRPKQ